MAQGAYGGWPQMAQLQASAQLQSSSQQAQMPSSQQVQMPSPQPAQMASPQQVQMPQQQAQMPSPQQAQMPSQQQAQMVWASSPLAWSGLASQAAAQQRNPNIHAPSDQQGGSSRYVVYTTGNDGDEVVVRTLVGEYVERGTNHGRKVYQKASDQAGPDFVDVFLYYWDSRDGPSFEGWWFGNKLGGTQVWSHCTDNGFVPPNAGWKIPWDGAVRSTLVVLSKDHQAKVEAEERFKALSLEIAAVDSSARVALEQARSAAGDFSHPHYLINAEQLLSPHIAPLSEAMKKLAEAQRGAGEEVQFKLAQLANQVRLTTGTANAEITRIRSSRVKAEQEEKVKAMEQREISALQEIMPDATEKTSKAEDSVEKAMITHEMLSSSGDNMEELQRAVDEVEVAAKQAQSAIGEARIFLNSKMAVIRRFESDTIRNQAIGDLTRLQATLQEAQNKVNPLKNVRQDFIQRQAAQKMVSEILEQLTPTEAACDSADEAMQMLGTEFLTQEIVQQTDSAMKKATEHLAATKALIAERKAQAAGAAVAEIGKLEERVKASEMRMAQLRSTHKEASERMTCESLMKEAGEKLAAVQEAVSRAADAEGPFLMGVEELPIEETLTAVKACETAAMSANTCVSIARMFIAAKLVEAKRFSPGPSQDATGKLQDLQKQLAAYTKRLSDLKTATTSRKHNAYMREADTQVKHAEALAAKMAEAAGVLRDDSKLADLTADDIKAASDKTQEAEQAANAALADARKYITAKQIESKSKDASAEASAEMIKFQTRLTVAQSEVAMTKKLVFTVDQRIAARRNVEEAGLKVVAAEEKVARAAELIAALSSESPSGQSADGATTSGQESTSTKEAEAVAQEAQMSLKTVARHLEQQARQVVGAAKEEYEKFQPRIKECQSKLDAAMTTMRERAETSIVSGIVTECEQRVQEAEEAVKKTAGLETPFVEGNGEVAVDEATKSLATLDAAAQAAHTAVGSTKTFLAMKRLAAKRLSEKAAAKTSEELARLQGRLEIAAKDLGEVKKGMAERRHATVRREVVAKIADAKGLVEAAKGATEALLGHDMAPDDMKASCERAGTAQHNAHKAIEETRKILAARQRDAKATTIDSSMLNELTKLMEQCTALQSQLDNQKTVLRDQEHNFVAQRLLKDATDMVENLEQKMAATRETAAPLVSDEKENFTGAIFLEQIVRALKQHMKNNSKSIDSLFQEMSGNGEKVGEKQFLSFLNGLPELTEQKDAIFSEDELKAAFTRLDGNGDGEALKKHFLDQFQTKYVCTATVAMTDKLAVVGGKSIRKVAVNEVLEALAEPVTDPGPGLSRVKVKAEKDGKEGYITLAGNQGTVYLQPYSAYTACEKRVDRAIQELSDVISQTLSHVEQKTEELKAVKSGPLAETKAELLKLKPRIGAVQEEQQSVQRKFADAQSAYREAIESEKKRREEAVERRAVKKVMEECNEQVNTLQEQVDAALAAAEALLKPKSAEQENLPQDMAGAEKGLHAVQKSISKVSADIKAKLDELREAKKGPSSDARSVLVKLKVRVADFDKRCAKQAALVQAARKSLADEACKAVRAGLAAHLQKEGITPEALFKQLSQGKQCISVSDMQTFLKGMATASLKASEIAFGLDCYSGGISKLSLLGMLQEYLKCAKDIAITTGSTVIDGKTLRKIHVGEIVEVLEQETVDKGTGLARVKCRTLMDNKEGWATLQGNAGTNFLEPCQKPYYSCEEEVLLQSSFESSSSTVRKICQGEVLEVLEGPRQEESVEVMRVRGVAAKDKKSGWVTLKVGDGEDNFVSSKVMVCKQSIAITTIFDITESKALRKLEPGEGLEMLEEAKEDPAKGLTRMKLRAKRDGKEGWVTIKGNQGTAYVEESDKHFVCRSSVPLESRFPNGSSTMRILEEGELFEVLEGPMPDSKEGAKRMRGRIVSDGAEGWFTLTESNVRFWAPRYSCASSTALTEELGLSKGEGLRDLEPGESLEALDGPVVEASSGLLRVRLRAERDGAVGYATVRAQDGTVHLNPLLLDG